ncbi:MAG: ATP-binding protein [Clostridiales bacterium]|nr:ATP-binding protein [Clostridiales bacterium]
MDIPRHLAGKVLDASRHCPVAMVCGQRQVGKSTLLNHLREPGRGYVTLDDGNARRLATTDPALFFETYGYPLLIDEFQRAPSILLEMKNIVDKKALSGEDNSGMFWLTGSQKFRMMNDVSESLAGRIAIFDLSSLSAAEIEGRPAAIFRPDLKSLRERLKYSKKKTVHEVYEDIFLGGMPKLRSAELDRDRFYMDYVNTYIERDVRDLAQVGKLSEFYDFLVYMAARTGQELKYGDIAGAIGVSSPTIKSWISILESSGIIFILRPYYSNLTKRLVKTPKVFFMDTGLAAYLCRWPNASTLESGAMDGAFFETYAVSEIVKSYHNAGKPVDLFYYRDIDKKEIDLLIVEGDKIFPVEIKKSKQPSNPDKNFAALRQFKMEVQPGIVLCMSDELVPYNRESWYCPISVL